MNSQANTFENPFFTSQKTQQLVSTGPIGSTGQSEQIRYTQTISGQNTSGAQNTNTSYSGLARDGGQTVSYTAGGYTAGGYTGGGYAGGANNFNDHQAIFRNYSGGNAGQLSRPDARNTQTRTTEIRVNEGGVLRGQSTSQAGGQNIGQGVTTKQITTTTVTRNTAGQGGANYAAGIGGYNAQTSPYRLPQVNNEFILRDNQNSARSVQNKVGYTQQKVLQQAPRPQYQQIYSNQKQRNQAYSVYAKPRVDDQKDKGCCSLPILALLGLLSVAGIVLGILFGLGVIGGVRSPFSGKEIGKAVIIDGVQYGAGTIVQQIRTEQLPPHKGNGTETVTPPVIDTKIYSPYSIIVQTRTQPIDNSTSTDQGTGVNPTPVVTPTVTTPTTPTTTTTTNDTQGGATQPTNQSTATGTTQPQNTGTIIVETRTQTPTGNNNTSASTTTTPSTSTSGTNTNTSTSTNTNTASSTNTSTTATTTNETVPAGWKQNSTSPTSPVDFLKLTGQVVTIVAAQNANNVSQTNTSTTDNNTGSATTPAQGISSASNTADNTSSIVIQTTTVNTTQGGATQPAVQGTGTGTATATGTTQPQNSGTIIVETRTQSPTVTNTTGVSPSTSTSSTTSTSGTTQPSSTTDTTTSSTTTNNTTNVPAGWKSNSTSTQSPVDFLKLTGDVVTITAANNTSSATNNNTATASTNTSTTAANGSSSTNTNSTPATFLNSVSEILKTVEAQVVYGAQNNANGTLKPAQNGSSLNTASQSNTSFAFPPSNSTFVTTTQTVQPVQPKININAQSVQPKVVPTVSINPQSVQPILVQPIVVAPTVTNTNTNTTTTTNTNTNTNTGNNSNSTKANTK